MLGYVYGHTAGTRLTWNALGLVWLRPVDKLFAGPGLTRKLSSNQDFGIKVAAPIGNLFGQLLFGFLADIVGRKRMCMCDHRLPSLSYYVLIMYVKSQMGRS